MDNPNQIIAGDVPTPKRPEVCHIEVIFPVDSDEDALKYKTAVSNALKDIPSKRFTFSIRQG